MHMRYDVIFNTDSDRFGTVKVMSMFMHVDDSTKPHRFNEVNIIGHVDSIDEVPDLLMQQVPPLRITTPWVTNPGITAPFLTAQAEVNYTMEGSA